MPKRSRVYGYVPGGIGGEGYSVNTGAFGNHATLANDLVSYWKLQETSGTRVDSRGSNDLTDNNTVASAAGIIGNSASFIAANDESLTRASFQSMSGVFTWSFWFQRPSITNTVGFITKMPAWGNSIEYAIYTTGGASGLIDLVVGDGAAQRSVSTASLQSLDTWYFIVAWLDTDKIPRISADNGATNAGSALAGTPASDATSTLYFGDGVGTVVNYDGRIDEVGLWSRALTAAERTSLYNSGAGLTY